MTEPTGSSPRGEHETSGPFRRLTEEWERALVDWPAEGIEVRLHTAPLEGDPEPAGWAWASAPATAETITHWSMWDAPSDRPRRLVGRPLRWLGETLIRLGTRKAKLLGTWERSDLSAGR